MLVNNFWVKVFFLISALGIGISAGIANASAPVLANTESSTLSTYNSTKSAAPHFKTIRLSVHSENLSTAGNITQSCFRVRQMSKPISIYRNRFCAEHSSGRQSLAQHSIKRVIF